jgi:hypothetical protein
LQAIGFIFVAIWIWSLAEGGWYSKWRYALTYGVDAKNVIVKKKPHDCSFLASPLGTKYCHYDREITTLQWATSAEWKADCIMGMKTWTIFAPDPPSTVPKAATVEKVYVSWKKIDE